MDNEITLPANPTADDLYVIADYLHEHTDFYVDLACKGPFVMGMGATYVTGNEPGKHYKAEVRAIPEPMLVLDDDNFETVCEALGIEFTAPTLN